MEVEAALYPPSIRLNTSIRKYAIQTRRLSPSHLIRLALESVTLQSQSQSQLGRIQSSIQDLVDLDSLELIQNYKYPPWERAIPYSVNISSLSKDDEAIAHNQRLA